MYKSLFPGLLGVETDLAGAAGLARRHGFAGVDASLAALAAVAAGGDAGRARGVLAEAGLRPGTCMVLPTVVSAEEGEWSAGLARLPGLARTARDLGYTRTGLVVLPFHDTLDYAQVMDLHVSRVGRAAGVLADHGLAVGLEYVAPKTRRAGHPCEFVHDLRGMLDLCEAIGAPNVGLLLDTFHWHCAGETGADLERLRAEQVVLVHASDAVAGRARDEQLALERELPGASGVIDLGAFVAALRRIGYAGPVTCEPMNRAVNALGAEGAVRAASEALDLMLGG